MKRIVMILMAVAMCATATAQISQQDFDALRAIYEKMGGEQWRNAANWDFSKTPADVTVARSDGSGWYGITEIRNRRVTKLELVSNNVSGEICEELYSLTELRVLNLSKNRLTGGISPLIGSLTKLVSIMLDENHLSGELPAEFVNIGSQADVRAPSDTNAGTEIRISLRSNGFTGALPDVSKIEMMYRPCRWVKIDLSANKFSGELPESYTKIEQLDMLLLNRNQLTGAVPEGFLELPILRMLNLERNKFIGTVPQK